MARRTPGSGSVEELPSGKWRYQFKIDGRRVRGPAVATRVLAEEGLAAAMAAVLRGDVFAGSTLGAWGAAWLDTRRTANASTERGMWRLHVEPCEIAELPLAEVRPRALLAWARGLRRHRKMVQVVGGPRVEGDPISVQTQRLAWALMRRVLGAAVEEELIAVNPARGLRPDWPDGDLDADALTFLDEAEIVQLLSCEAVPLAARLHYGWAIGAGPRQRESWGLRWGQVDLVELTATLTRSGWSTTKAKKPRPFPLLRMAAESLERWYDICPDPRPDALVWPARILPPAPGGTRWRSPGTMRADGGKGDDFGWAPRSRGEQGVSPGHRRLAGIREGVTYHDLRHTCAAGLLRGYAILGGGRRWSLEEVCDFLGHSDRRTTERYAHVAGGGLAARAAAEAAAEEATRPTGGPRPASLFELPPSVTAARFERATYCLGKGSTVKDSAGIGGSVGLAWASARELGRSVQLVAAGGAPVPGVLLGGLAGAAAGLGVPALSRLARAVERGGPHAVDRALDLAQALDEHEAGAAQRGRPRRAAGAG